MQILLLIASRETSGAAYVNVTDHSASLGIPDHFIQLAQTWFGEADKPLQPEPVLKQSMFTNNCNSSSDCSVTMSFQKYARISHF